MIDIEKYLKWVNEYTGHTEVEKLQAEVEKLQAWKKLVSDIVQQHDGSHLRKMLKELVE